MSGMPNRTSLILAAFFLLLGILAAVFLAIGMTKTGNVFSDALMIAIPVGLGCIAAVDARKKRSKNS